MARSPSKQCLLFLFFVFCFLCVFSPGDADRKPSAGMQARALAEAAAEKDAAAAEGAAAEKAAAEAALSR